MRALALVLIGGCSFAFVRRSESTRVRPSCSTTYSAPVVDSIVAVPLAIVGIGAFIVDRSRDSGLTDTMRAGIGLPAISLAALTIASAVYGYLTVHNCRDAIEAYDVQPR
jgi:hypothetical protein